MQISPVLHVGREQNCVVLRVSTFADGNSFLKIYGFYFKDYFFFSNIYVFVNSYLTKGNSINKDHLHSGIANIPHHISIYNKSPKLHPVCVSSASQSNSSFSLDLAS